jgi:hypothetical protein
MWELLSEIPLTEEGELIASCASQRTYEKVRAWRVFGRQWPNTILINSARQRLIGLPGAPGT